MSLEEEEEEKELQFFKKMVKEYMKLDDEIKKLERTLSQKNEADAYISSGYKIVLFDDFEELS